MQELTPNEIQAVAGGCGCILLTALSDLLKCVTPTIGSCTGSTGSTATGTLPIVSTGTTGGAQGG